jgi:hypothetical protein
MEQKTKKSRPRKLVYQFEVDGTFIQEFESVAKTAEIIGVSAPLITMCCGGKRNSVRGYLFSFDRNFIPKKEGVECLICHMWTSDKRSLASHLTAMHKEITTEEYTIQYLLGGNKPSCIECGKETRYVSFEFKRYCKEHSHLAEAEAGKIGGKIKATWNKGKTKEDDVRLFNQSIAVTGSRNHFFGKQHSELTKEVISNKGKLTEEEWTSRIEKRNKEFEILSTYEGYFSRQLQRLKLVCKKCGLKQEKTLVAYERGSLCIKCHPFVTSRAEVDIGDFVEQILGLPIERNNRKLIGPKELDVYVPSKKFAIEYNGLYWHMQKEGDKAFNKNKHLDKFNSCIDQGINLFHIFSDEWINKTDLIKSMLRSRLSKSEVLLDARKCIVDMNVSSKEAEVFFERTHISGQTKASKYFGLRYDGKLVSCVSLRTPFHKKYRESKTIEIARFSTELNTNIRGGFGKLLKVVERYCFDNGYKSILSYCDLRFGMGKVYESTGFELMNDNTGMNYWYTDGISRFDRFNTRAKDGKTEAQIAEEKGFSRVYGCGNKVFLKQIKETNTK